MYHFKLFLEPSKKFDFDKNVRENLFLLVYNYFKTFVICLFDEF